MDTDVGVVFEELGDAVVADATLPHVDISEGRKPQQVRDAVLADVRVVEVQVVELKRSRELR